jgi:hypothetical protein
MYSSTMDAIGMIEYVRRKHRMLHSISHNIIAPLMLHAWRTTAKLADVICPYSTPCGQMQQSRGPETVLLGMCGLCMGNCNSPGTGD